MEKIQIENRAASRSLYALIEVFGVLAGTLTALLCAITVGVANLLDASQWPEEELEKIYNNNPKIKEKSISVVAQTTFNAKKWSKIQKNFVAFAFVLSLRMPFQLSRMILYL